MPVAELRLPDFPGLMRPTKPTAGGALVARNCDINKRKLLARRGGYRRMNQQRYNGAITAIIECARICDYGKLLICSGFPSYDEDSIPPWGGDVFEHEESGVAGGSGAEPAFDENWPPMAIARAAPVVGTEPLAVQFDGSLSFDPEGGPIGYSWDFQDGSPTVTAMSPLHTFAADGVYPVTLTVTDLEGATDTDIITITVNAGIGPVLWDSGLAGLWSGGP